MTVNLRRSTTIPWLKSSAFVGPTLCANLLRKPFELFLKISMALKLSISSDMPGWKRFRERAKCWDITHPNMRRRIEKPRIILLDCPLEYKKGELQTNMEFSKEADWARAQEIEDEQIKQVCCKLGRIQTRPYHHREWNFRCIPFSSQLFCPWIFPHRFGAAYTLPKQYFSYPTCAKVGQQPYCSLRWCHHRQSRGSPARNWCRHQMWSFLYQKNWWRVSEHYSTKAIFPNACFD